MIARLLPLILLLLTFAPSQAQAQTAGAACANAGQFHENGTESLVCDSSIWKPVINFYGNGSIGFQAGADTGSCTSVKTGRMRYISSTWEYCSGSSWQTFDVSTTASCNIHGQSIGYVCPDGSVFAGFAPYTASYQPIFATRCDAGQTWNGSACSGTRLTLPWNNGNAGGLVTTTATNSFDGRTNTNTLVATDSDSGAPGTQPHQAAAYCDNLIMHGKSDWYLPSIGEYLQLIASSTSIGNFGNHPAYYWTAYEYSYGNPAGGYAVGLPLIEGGNSKDTANNIRCIRR